MVKIPTDNLSKESNVKKPSGGSEGDFDLEKKKTEKPVQVSGNPVIYSGVSYLDTRRYGNPESENLYKELVNYAKDGESDPSWIGTPVSSLQPWELVPADKQIVKLARPPTEISQP